MKNTLKLLLLLPALAFLACSNPSAYKVEIELTGLEDGTMIALTPAGTHDDEQAVATAPLQGGRVSFEGEVEGPRYFAVSVEGSFGNVGFFLDKGYNVSVSADVEPSPRTDFKIYQFTNAKIEGSPLTDQYKTKMAYREELNAMHQRYTQENAEVGELVTAARGAGNQAELYRIMQTDAYKKLQQQEHDFFAAVEQLSHDSYMENKDSWWGPFLMLNTMSYFTPEQREIFEQFSPEAQQSFYGQKVKAELYPESLLGKPVPDFTVTDSEGRKVGLKELSQDKKYILIDFWASWCGPCRREIPNLKKEYAEFASKGFEIVSISIDKEADDWCKALDEENLPWPNFLDTDSSISKAYSVRSIPALFLIDANGILVAQDLRGEELNAKLHELLD